MELESVAELAAAATQEVFRTMLGTEVTPQTAFADNGPPVQSEIMGAVGMQGDICGYVSVHCTRNQAEEFTLRLLNIQRDELDSALEVRDAIAELVNMVSGSLKSALASELWIETALPLVIDTPKLLVRFENARGWIVPIQDPSGAFHVEITAFEETA